MKLKMYEAMLSVLILLTVTTFIVWAISTSYVMTATVKVDETVTAYLDFECTTEVPKPHDWGEIEDGTVIPAWIKNDGNVQVDVTITISGETDCTVTPSWIATTLTVGQAQQLDMTISTVATPETSISWQLDIDSVKSTP